MRPGDRVTLRTPDNPHLDGRPAVVEEVTHYGAVVRTGVGSGEFRATHDEMIPADGQRNGHAPPPAFTPSGDLCGYCGSPNMTRAGACMVCLSCGSSSGCS